MAEAYIARLAILTRNARGSGTRPKGRGGPHPNKVFRASTRRLDEGSGGAPFGRSGFDTAGRFRKSRDLDAPAAVKAKLLSDASAALTGPFRDGYGVLIAAIDEVAPKSKGNFGVWSLPGGDAYYADRLKNSTTTDLTADQIHDLGLKQVAAIRQEMEAISRSGSRDA